MLSPKEKALIGVGLSVASGCRPCTESYVALARNAGACERGVRLAIETGLAIRNAATNSMAQFAEDLQGEPPVLDDEFRAPRAKLVELIACGAAIVQNSADVFRTHLDLALAAGAVDTDVISSQAIGRSVSKTAADNCAVATAIRTSAQDTQTAASRSDDTASKGASAGCGCGCGCSD